MFQKSLILSPGHRSGGVFARIWACRWAVIPPGIGFFMEKRSLPSCNASFRSTLVQSDALESVGDRRANPGAFADTAS